jgi:tRNA (guanine37-N1)-methyltransferase
MGLREQLAEKIPTDLQPHISGHFEVIGDIAVITLHPGLEPWKYTIAETIVSGRKNIVTVLKKTEKITGDSRAARYEILLGESTVTICREFGFSYHVDIRSSFFSTKMANERKRVTAQVEAGEKVYVPFSGVGPYVVPAAARGAEVWAMEKNPDAFRWLTKNTKMNRVGDQCHLLQGDALETSLLPHTEFDRLIIPAPYGMDHALEVLLPCLSYGGMAHFYTFKKKEQLPGLIAAYEGGGLEVVFHASCGNVAPGVSRWVFDMVRQCPR